MDRKGNQGFVIEQGGPNGWSIVGAGAFVGMALIIIALALFSISQYVGIAVIVAAAGQFVLAGCTGAARIVEARGRARALAMRARVMPPGPEAQADMKNLWGGG